MIAIVYYAHALETYDTEQERWELELIEMFFSNGLVFNPNRPSVRYAEDPMRTCLDIVKDDSISALAFGEVTGEITQGVQREIHQARNYEKPVFCVSDGRICAYTAEIEPVPNTHRYRRVLPLGEPEL